MYINNTITHLSFKLHTLALLAQIGEDAPGQYIACPFASEPRGETPEVADEAVVLVNSQEAVHYASSVLRLVFIVVLEVNPGPHYVQGVRQQARHEVGTQQGQ